MLPDRRHFANLPQAVILPLAALIAVLPLILRGCSCGHDFDFHIINWFEAAKQFSHGIIHPHWAFTPAWSAGEPRFVFYPPLSWAIGGVLGLLMPWSWTPIVYTWLALTIAGFTLHYSVRSFVPRNAALIASCIYIANPYTLYTAYERTAYAELLAAAWLPLALSGILREQVSITGIAVPIALLWLTNAPAAVMGTYLVLLIAVIRLALSLKTNTFAISTSRLHFALSKTLGILLGLGIAALYIIPAVYEQRFVQIGMAILPGLSPQENFLFRHTSDPDHDAVLRTASILAVVLLILTTAIIVFVQTRLETLPVVQPRRSRLNCTPPTLSFTLIAITAVIAFMLTPLSSIVWRYLPELRFLQFPWRLLAILAIVFAFGAAMALSRVSRFAVPLALAAAAVLTVPSYIAFHQRCYPEDTLEARLATFRTANPGTDPTDEYTPITADNDALAQMNPGYWLAGNAGNATIQPQPCTAPCATAAPAPRQLALTLDSPQLLVLNLRDYPAWRISVNGALVTTRLRRNDGLIAFPLPAGHSEIRIRYATMRDQQIGYVVSSIALLLFTTLLVLRSRHILPRPVARSTVVRILRPFP
jgi:hypothetical protein